MDVANDIWSKYVQGTKTLYYTRKQRFDDMFSEQYKTLFKLNENTKVESHSWRATMGY